MVRRASAISRPFHADQRVVAQSRRALVRQAHGQTDQARRAPQHRALEAAIREYLTITNESPKPFVWTKPPTRSSPAWRDIVSESLTQDTSAHQYGRSADRHHADRQSPQAPARPRRFPDPRGRLLRSLRQNDAGQDRADRDGGFRGPQPVRPELPAGAHLPAGRLRFALGRQSRLEPPAGPAGGAVPALLQRTARVARLLSKVLVARDHRAELAAQPARRSRVRSLHHHVHQRVRCPD